MTVNSHGLSNLLGDFRYTRWPVGTLKTLGSPNMGIISFNNLSYFLCLFCSSGEHFNPSRESVYKAKCEYLNPQQKDKLCEI